MLFDLQEIIALVVEKVKAEDEHDDKREQMIKKQAATKEFMQLGKISTTLA